MLKPTVTDVLNGGGPARDLPSRELRGRNLLPTRRFEWPTVACIAFLAVLVYATQETGLFSNALDTIREVSLTERGSAGRYTARVLVITANPKHRLDVVATLSPRGLEPLLAQDLKAVSKMLESRASEIRLAVLDRSVPQSAGIAKLLRSALPAGRIVELNSNLAAGEIGPLLLARL